MSNNSQFQMVEIDQNPFAVEIRNGNIGVNLTQMAKPFGKKPKDWLKRDTTKSYLDAISKRTNVPLPLLITIAHGGATENHGTWAHDYRIAMRFAQWLSADFAIEVDDLLIKLLTGELKLTGYETNVLPKLINVLRIWNGGNYYPYIETLKSAGLSTSSGSVWRRIRKNSQEFIGENGVWLVSEIYGKNIYINTLAAKVQQVFLSAKFILLLQSKNITIS